MKKKARMRETLARMKKKYPGLLVDVLFSGDVMTVQLVAMGGVRPGAFVDAAHFLNRHAAKSGWKLVVLT